MLNLTTFRNRNQSMTLEPADQNIGSVGPRDEPSSTKYLPKSKVDGLYSTHVRAKYNLSDIKRNASVAVVGQLGVTPQDNKLLATSRKNIFGSKNPMQTTMA